MLEIVAVGIGALISAIGAVVSAVYAANTRSRTREIARLESDMSEADRERAGLQASIRQVESEVWGHLRNLPEAHPTRREFDHFVAIIADLRGEIKELRSEVKNDTEQILKAIRDVV